MQLHRISTAGPCSRFTLNCCAWALLASVLGGRKSAIIVGPKKNLYVASYPVEQRDEMALRVEAMFDIPCGTVPNFLNLTLTPSNQILHPGESSHEEGGRLGFVHYDGCECM